MNKLDEYWFWVMKAVTEPKDSNNVYYYNKPKDELFGLVISDKEIVPMFRNEMSKNEVQIVTSFADGIFKAKNLDPNILQLPKISLAEKRSFFIHFISTIDDQLLQNELLSEINSFSESDVFSFKTNLKIKNPALNFTYDIERGKFIANKVIELYKPLGISEKSVIVW